MGGSKGSTGVAGSYTPVVTFDLVVVPQWLKVIPQREKIEALQSIIKKCVNTTIVAHIKS